MRALKEDVSGAVAAFERAAAGVGDLKTALLAALPMQREAAEATLLALVAGGGVLIDGPVEVRRAFVRAVGRVLGLDCAVVALQPASRFEDISEPRAARLATPQLRRPALAHPVTLIEEVSRTEPRARLAFSAALAEGGPLACRFVADAGLSPAEADRLALRVVVAGEVRGAGPALPGAAGLLAEARAVRAALPVGERVLTRALELVRRSRPQDPDAPDAVKAAVARGPGPRAGSALLGLMRARALAAGRAAATAEDLAAMAAPALDHRLAWREGADRGAAFAALLS